MGQTMLSLRNTHLEYALTWFSLSGALAVAALYRIKTIL
jgi:cytochrome oxidase assembly protein ShyY1